MSTVADTGSLNQNSGVAHGTVSAPDFPGRLDFTLVIPALNEEEAVASTLHRALAARQFVIDHTPVKSMTVVLVNDGSTDRTHEISQQFPEVIKIRFEENRGYGAAIMAGFGATDTELVSFMDADGTCDPQFLAPLINHLLATNSDVVVGSRMNNESEMPVVRRLGNFIFARLIGAVSGQKITDSASGMRVIRRESLRRMHPLPTGLHFTPAMTCMALLDRRLRITEVPMPYKERVGESKLRVIKDGFRFLFIILFTAALFNPIKALSFLGLIFLLFGLACVSVAQDFGSSPTVVMAMTFGFGAVCLQAGFVGFLCHQLLQLLLGPWRVSSFGELLIQKYCSPKNMVWSGVVMLTISGLVYAASVAAPLSWRTALGLTSALLVVASGWTALAGIILRVIWAAKQRRIAELEIPVMPTVK